MKFKKVILIPASVMCLAALSSCGKTSDSIFAGLKNGYESVEYEKYFKLPSNLFTLEQGYGLYVAQTAELNTIKFMRSTKATNFEVGTAPFFANMPMFTPGTKDEAQALNSVNYNKMGSYVTVSPFSSSVSKREAETTVKYYGSKEGNPVLHEVETSIRSDYDSYTQTTIKSEPTNNEYIEYVDKIPETEDQQTIFMLVKGHKDQRVLLANDSSSEVLIYKKMLELPEGADPKEQLENDARATLITQLDNIKSAFLHRAECATYENLSKSEPEEAANYQKQYIGGDVRNVTYLGDGKGNIYQYSYIAKPDLDVPVYSSSDSPTVVGFEVSEAVAKLRYDNTLGWLLDNKTTAAKAYVKADEKLNPYATPKCLCSEYRHIDVNYNDLGEFGSIEDAELYKDAPDLRVQLTFHNLEEVTQEVPDKVLVFDPNEDENMYTNGGIYDHTFSARKAGLIKNNQYVFYGEANFGTAAFAPAEDPLEEMARKFSSNHYSVKTELITNDGKPAVNVEPYPGDEEKRPTIDEKLSETIKIREETEKPNTIEVNYGSDESESLISVNARKVNFYIQLVKNQDNTYTVEEFTITPGSTFGPYINR